MVAAGDGVSILIRKLRGSVSWLVRGASLGDHLKVDVGLIRATSEWLGRIKDGRPSGCRCRQSWPRGVGFGQALRRDEWVRGRGQVRRGNVRLVSRRPADWSPLVGSDPVPGDPEEIERAAKSLTAMADEITRQAANLRKLATDLPACRPAHPRGAVVARIGDDAGIAYSCRVIRASPSWNASFSPHCALMAYGYSLETSWNSEYG